MNCFTLGGMKGPATDCNALNTRIFFPRRVRMDYEEPLSRLFRWHVNGAILGRLPFQVLRIIAVNQGRSFPQDFGAHDIADKNGVASHIDPFDRVTASRFHYPRFFSQQALHTPLRLICTASILCPLIL
jgi:hypothetical protein